MKISKYLLIAFAGMLAAGCSSDWLDEDPEHLVIESKLYVDVAGFQVGLNGLYSQMRVERDCSRFQSSDYYRDLTGMCAFISTDDYCSVTTGGEMGGILGKPSSYLMPSSTAIDKLWSWYYRIINAANTILEHSRKESVDWMADNVDHKNRIVGEALLARAWAYRSLVAYWGAVPIKLDQSVGENIRTDFYRSPEVDVWKQMVEDLTLAAEYIPWSPYMPGSATKGVALHYLAETYLTLGKRALDEGRSDAAAEYYKQAERYASILIGTGGAISQEDLETFGTSNRSLMPDFCAMFEPTNVEYATNTETLWTWQWAANTLGGGYNAMRYAFISYYAGARRGFGSKPIFDNGNLYFYPSEERGGEGWCEAAFNQRVMELYYHSSTTESLPAKSDAAACEAFWNRFRYEDRGSERSIRKFFILNRETDYMANPDKINPSTGAVWATGDTVWISNAVDASKRYLAMGNDFRYTPTPSNGAYLHTLKWAYCDPGRNLETDSHLNQMYLRLAETILLRAEARVFQNRVGEAADDINMLRSRAHALPVTAADFGPTLREQVDFVLDERTRELLCEEQRRFTLIRLGRKEYLWRRARKYNKKDASVILQETMYLPIPQTVIDANLTLPMLQNPGFGGVPIDPDGWIEEPAWSLPS